VRLFFCTKTGFENKALNIIDEIANKAILNSLIKKIKKTHCCMFPLLCVSFVSSRILTLRKEKGRIER